MRRSTSMDSAQLDNWASCFGLPATPRSKQSKAEKNEFQRRDIPHRNPEEVGKRGASFSNRTQQHVMDEVTQRIQNIDIGVNNQASRTQMKRAVAVVKQEAESLENRGNRSAALKLVQVALDDEVDDRGMLLRFQMDLQRRKKAAENLKRRAILNAIAETYVTTAAADTCELEDAATVRTPGVAIAALSFNSMHDQGTVGGTAPDSAASIVSKTPMPLSTPSLPPSTMSTPTFDYSPLETEEEEPHEGVGVRRLNSSSAVSPLLEEVFCESDGVSLALSSGHVQNSSSDDRPSASTQSSASASEKLHTACKYSGRSSRRSSLREPRKASLPYSHRSSLNVRFDPQVSVTADQHVSSGPDEPPTPDGCLVALDAGNTPYNTSEPVREQRVSLIEEPTACYSAPEDLSQLCESGSDWHPWVDGSRVSERLSINAGSTPRRSTKPVVSFLTVGAHDASVEADSPVGATQWAQALAVVAPAKGVATPSAELGDVDMTPAGSLEGADGDGSPTSVEEDDANSHEPEPTPSAMLRLSMDAGHTPAPSRTASMMDVLTDSDDGGVEAANEPATAPLAPLHAEGTGVLESEAAVPQEAAHLDFNTHGVMRVGRLDADNVGRVSFAANTVDAVTVGSSHAPMAHVITPHVLQKPVQGCIRPSLNMPSSHSMLAPTGQAASARGPLAGSLFPTPATGQTPNLGAGVAGIVSTGDGGAQHPGTRRKPTPATGAMHMPCAVPEESDGEGDDLNEMTPEGGLSGSLFMTPAGGTMAIRGLQAVRAVHPSADECSFGESLGKEDEPHDAGMMQHLQNQDADVACAAGADSLGELQLPDDGFVAATSPGHSSISFGSPAKSVLICFGSPMSEVSAKSSSQSGQVGALPGGRMSHPHAAVDFAPSPAGTPLARPLGNLMPFASAGGFMPELPELPDETAPSRTPQFSVAAPASADNASQHMGCLSLPGGPLSCDTDELLLDDVPTPCEVLLASRAAAEEAEEQEDDHVEVRALGTGQIAVHEALAALRVSWSERTAGSLSDGSRRELKSLMSDSVASKVAAAAGEMGTHEVLVPVKAAAGQRSAHGTPKVLTPVRRSRRSMAGATPPPDISAQLAGTKWTYSPNPAL